LGDEQGQAHEHDDSGKDGIEKDSAVEVAKAIDGLDQEKKMKELREKQEERARQKKAEDDYKKQLLANIEKDRKRRSKQTQEELDLARSGSNKTMTGKSSGGTESHNIVEDGSDTQSLKADWTKMVFRMRDPAGKQHSVKHSFPHDATLNDTLIPVHSSLTAALGPHPMPSTIHYVTTYRSHLES